MAEAFIHNTSELLAILCLAGLIATIARWPTAIRRDYLAAFFLFLLGAFIREIVVWEYGSFQWPTEAIIVSGTGRIFQIIGAVLFVRAAMSKICGEWGWAIVLAVALIGAILI